LHYVQNLQNYATFNQGNLTFSRYQNLSNANTVSVNTFWVTANAHNIFHQLSRILSTSS